EVFVARDLADGGELVGDGLERGDLAVIHLRHAELDRVAAAEDGSVAAALPGEPREAFFRLRVGAAGWAAALCGEPLKIQLAHLIVPEVDDSQLAADCVSVAGEYFDRFARLD